MIEEIPKKKSLSKRALVPFGCFGWVLFIVGSAYLIRQYWMDVWDWFLLGFGVLFYIRAFSGEDKQYLFPGTILIVTMSALLFRSFGLIEFPLWKFWPILFLSTGLAIIILWAVRDSRAWVFIPGGILLLAGGGGIGFDSWWRYQRWLREVVDLWPLIVIGLGVYLIFSYMRKRSDQPTSNI